MEESLTSKGLFDYTKVAVFTQSTGTTEVPQTYTETKASPSNLLILQTNMYSSYFPPNIAYLVANFAKGEKSMKLKSLISFLCV